jgi:hypothetical protein
MCWQVECSTAVSTDSPPINLTPLIRLDENYKVQIGNDTVVYINVCRPLLPVRGLSCAGGSSACIAHLHSDSLTDEKVQGLNLDVVQLHQYIKGNVSQNLTLCQSE